MRERPTSTLRYISACLQRIPLELAYRTPIEPPALDYNWRWNCLLKSYKLTIRKSFSTDKALRA